jgi:tripartite-type tricarboxylate transporter receptor subunit TctC
METWFAVAVPAGTPGTIIEKLRAAAIGAMGDPAVAEAFASDGAEVATSTPEELQALMRVEFAKYGTLVKSLNIRD